MKSCLFGNETLQRFQNGSELRIFETFSELKGRCFTIESVQLESSIMVLGLKPGLKLDMFIHGKGEEVWLQFGAFPFMVSSALIDTMDENGPQVV